MFALLMIISSVFAHSWVECTNYNGDLENFEPEKCEGLPRPLQGNRNVGGTFGQDIGMDFQPGNARCQGDATLGTAANFPNGMVTYETGKTYTLAWPSKNHVAATCTSQYIPDTFVRLYMTAYDQTRGDPDQDTFKQNQVQGSFSSDPHVNGQIDFKGFQNCPRFCENTDKSLCTGTFSIGADVAPGVYTFQWYWAFNSEAQLYSTCWEAIVAPGSTSTGTGLPETTTTANPTPEDCVDCCDAGEVLAPGSGSLVSYNYLTNTEVRELNCPSGYDGEFKLLCLLEETRIVDGFCQPSSARNEYIAKIEQQKGTIVGLSLSLAFLGLAFICLGYNLKKDRMSWEWRMSNHGLDDLEVSKQRKGRVDSVFTSSNTELPVLPGTPENEWHYVDQNNQQVGPVSESKLIMHCKRIQIKQGSARDVYIWNPNMADWSTVAAVPQLSMQLK